MDAINDYTAETRVGSRKEIIDLAAVSAGVKRAELQTALGCRDNYLTRRIDELMQDGLLFRRQHHQEIRYFAHQYHADAWVAERISPDLPSNGAFAMAAPRRLHELQGVATRAEPLRRAGSMDFAACPSLQSGKRVYRDGREEVVS